MELATLEYPYNECRNPAQIFRKVTQVGQSTQKSWTVLQKIKCCDNCLHVKQSPSGEVACLE
eukprot:scaffold60193_cov21-Tisochrysis_lutea.AAC.1